MSDIKTYCYKSDCGPVVETGFHLEQYKVCRACKCEINDYLANQIKQNQAKKEPPKEEVEDMYQDLFGYQYLGND